MNPIKTIITNKTAASKTIHWAGKDTKWLPANGQTTVPFEVWSVATDAQRVAIKTAVATGAIELSLRVLGNNGEYAVVPFNPCGAPAPSSPASQPVDINTTKQQVAELDHTVRVVSTETANVMEAYGAKPVPVGAEDEELPVRELKNGEPEQAAEEAKEEPKQEEAPATGEAAAPKKRRSKKAE